MKLEKYTEETAEPDTIRELPAHQTIVQRMIHATEAFITEWLDKKGIEPGSEPLLSPNDKLEPEHFREMSLAYSKGAIDTSGHEV